MSIHVSRSQSHQRQYGALHNERKRAIEFLRKGGVDVDDVTDYNDVYSRPDPETGVRSGVSSARLRVIGLGPTSSAASRTGGRLVPASDSEGFPSESRARARRRGLSGSSSGGRAALGETESGSGSKPKTNPKTKPKTQATHNAGSDSDEDPFGALADA